MTCEAEGLIVVGLSLSAYALRTHALHALIKIGIPAFL